MSEINVVVDDAGVNIQIGGGATTLAAMTDTTITSPADNSFLVYNGSVWINEALATAQATLGVVSTLSTLTDTTITAPADNSFLVYNGSVWINEALATAKTTLSVNYASTAEVIAGTEAAKIVSPAELKPKESIAVAVSDETTALTTGTAKVTFRMPYAFTLSDIRASVTTAPTGSVLTVDVNEAGTTILSTELTIDAGEKTSTTAATAPVISDTSLADDAEITIDIDTIGSSVAGAGLKVYLIGNRT